jgi:glutathione synthase/RimK-type ligase-like ATP-grasp enzyme
LSNRILIFTEADDFHAIAVAEALDRKGAAATLWATSDFPTRSDESVSFGADGRRTLRIRGGGLDLLNPAFDVVWRRRPTYVLDRGALHPADRAFAENECSMFRRSLYRLLAPEAYWVNPVDGAARAGSKILQHEAAGTVGLTMPATVFTNSPREIREFLCRPGATVYKPLSPAGWKDEDRHFMPYTTLVTEANLVADEVLRQTPGIFQKLVPKAYELRVTVIGRQVLAAKVHSQETAKGKLDWRRSYDELRFERACLPPEVSERCLALLDKLGLVFGCFDFVVTPEGEHVFLEVNEMGQFLFVERYCGLPLLDAFAEFLLQGRPDFEWCEAGVTVRYGDAEFETAATARAAAFRAAHVASPEGLTDEGKGNRKRPGRNVGAASARPRRGPGPGVRSPRR